MTESIPLIALGLVCIIQSLLIYDLQEHVTDLEKFKESVIKLMQAQGVEL